MGGRLEHLWPLALQDHPGDDIDASGREGREDTFSVAQACAMDAACMGFTSRSGMKHTVLPAVPSGDAGTCLYVKQPGAGQQQAAGMCPKCSSATSCGLDLFTSKHNPITVCRLQTTSLVRHRRAGACPHVSGYTAVGGVDAVQGGAQRQAIAADVAAMAAQCGSASSCGGFTSTGEHTGAAARPCCNPVQRS